MEINPIKLNTEAIPNRLAFKEQQEVKPYLEAEGAIDTKGLVKPLPPKGHLVKDNPISATKYFFKDKAYDMKSVANGYKGVVNDHQAGRLNDVGLVMSGLMIATYLASRTKNPKARIMEYVGLGAFLVSMAIYPKIAINLPARLLHGFNIDKEYIDDQGRKKSVFQDSNYIPYDQYSYEDMEKIAKGLGLPKDIHNSHQLVMEQTRKIATQNDTLWMLTACVTPAMAALICCGLEPYISSALEKNRNTKIDKEIAKISEAAKNMKLNVSEIGDNEFATKITEYIKTFKGKELSKDELNKFIDMLTAETDIVTAEGIKTDITKILKEGKTGTGESLVFNKEIISEILGKGKAAIKGRNRERVSKAILPSDAEIEQILKEIVPDADLTKEVTISLDKLQDFRLKLRRLIEGKIETCTDRIPKQFLSNQADNIIQGVTTGIKTKKSVFVSDEVISKISSFAKILGEFKANQKLIDKCELLKMEHYQETVLANSYAKIEKTLFEILDIPFKNLKSMRDSDSITKMILNDKLEALCRDEARYKKAMEKLGKVLSEMDVKLNGLPEGAEASSADSNLLKLVNALENNFNNTAKRLKNLDGFSETIKALVNQDTDTLSPKVNNISELYDWLDGIMQNPHKDGSKGSERQVVTYFKDGVGSAKNARLERMLERYQGVKNSFNRFMHVMELYKRAQDPEKFNEALNKKGISYIERLIAFGKDAILSANTTDFTLKFNLINNSAFYKDLMESLYKAESGDFWSTKEKGFVTEAAKEALGKEQNFAKGNLLERFQYYITHFRNIIANDATDFTKPHHILNPYVGYEYEMSSKTPNAKFNLIAQSPVDLMRKGAGRRYSTQKWVRIVGGVTGAIFGIAILTQFTFGKIKNRHNIKKKQVQNDTSK